MIEHEELEKEVFSNLGSFCISHTPFDEDFEDLSQKLGGEQDGKAVRYSRIYTSLDNGVTVGRIAD